MSILVILAAVGFSMPLAGLYYALTVQTVMRFPTKAFVRAIVILFVGLAFGEFLTRLTQHRGLDPEMVVGFYAGTFSSFFISLMTVRRLQSPMRVLSTAPKY